LVIFQIAHGGLEAILFVLPHIAGMIGTFHHTQPLVEMGRGLENFLSKLALNL
jgi:hypothetical protein